MEVDAGSIATCTPEMYDIASTLVNVEEVTDNKGFSDFKVPTVTSDATQTVAEQLTSRSESETTSKNLNIRLQILFQSLLWLSTAMLESIVCYVLLVRGISPK
ncbi:unnamed protein product [Heterobilharzia americana]|nr:unnamed protein product [Heterobilharzia americana]